MAPLFSELGVYVCMYVRMYVMCVCDVFANAAC